MVSSIYHLATSSASAASGAVTISMHFHLTSPFFCVGVLLVISMCIVGAESSRPLFENALPVDLVSTTVPTVDPSCYSLLHAEDYTFSVSPPPQQPDLFTYGYVYNTGQNVTLTCQMKNAFMQNETDMSSLPYVVVRSCEPCNRRGNKEFIASDAGRGKAALEVIGATSTIVQIYLGCQFSCWQYNNTCRIPPTPDQFRPKTDECFDAHAHGQFRTIKFGVLPSTRDIKCVSRNWGGLTCIWTMTKVSSNNDTCSVHWRGPGTTGNITVDVQSGEGNTRFAEMSLGTRAFLLHQDYTISFAMRTLFGDVTATHQVRTDPTIVKYDAVQSLQVRADEHNSTLLQVEWAFPGIAAGLADHKRFDCRIHVTATSQPWMEYNATVPMSDDDCNTKQRVRVTGLHADVNYAVSMQFRLKGSKYWSDEVVSSNTTSEDVPSGAPEVTAGSYEIFFHDGNYQLYVYWKALEPQYRNGKLTNYKVVVTHSDQSQTFSIETTADVLSATIPHFNPTGGGNACVSAATSKGYSPETNCITILASKDDPKVPNPPEEVVVEYMANSNSYVLRWHDVTPISATGDHFAVFWCQGTLSGSPVKCLSDLNWTKLDNISATSYTVDALSSLGSLEDQTTWRFGVARNIGNLSRGISWNKCSFRNDTQKQVPYIATRREGSEISVTLTVKCDVTYFSQRPVRQEIYVTRMTPSFKGADCTQGHKVDVTFNPDLSRTVVVKDNLTLNSVYSVCARTYFANSGNGVISGPSNVSLTEIAGQDDSVWHRAIYGSVAVAFVMAVLFCVWLFWKKGKRASHKFTTSVDDNDFEIGRPRRARRSSPPGDGFSNGSFIHTITIDHTQPNAPPPNLPPPGDETSGSGDTIALLADQVREIPFVPRAAPVTTENIHPRPENLAENQQPANPCGVVSPQQPVTHYPDYLGIALSDEPKPDAEPLAEAMLDRSRGEVSGFGELPVDHAERSAPASASTEASSSILSTAYVQVATNRSPPPQPPPPPLQELEVQVYEVTASPHTWTKADGVSQESSGASVDSSSTSSLGSLCSADTPSSGEDSSSHTSGYVTATTLNENVEGTVSQANTVTFESDVLSRPSPNITVIAVGTGLSSGVQKADSALKSGYVQDMRSFGDTSPTDPPLSRSLNSDDSSSENTRGTALPAYVATTAVEKSLPEEDSTTTSTTEVRMTREHPEPDHDQNSAHTVTERVYGFQGSQNGLTKDVTSSSDIIELRQLSGCLTNDNSVATLTNEKDVDDSPNGHSTNESEKDNKLVETATNQSEPDYISKEVQGNNKPSCTESDGKENGTPPERAVTPHCSAKVNPYVRLDDEYPRCKQLNGSDGLKPTVKPLQFSNDSTGTHSTSDSEADTNSSGSTSPDDCNSRSVEITTDNSRSILGNVLKPCYVPRTREQLSTHRQGSVLSYESGYVSSP